MSLAVQREGKGWPSGALTPPTQPPASFLEISERTFVWAAKLNLPPSCQGIGKAVRGKGKGESGEGGGREGAAGRRAGESEQAIQAGRLLVPVTLNTASPRSCSSRGRRLSGFGHRNRDLATGSPVRVRDARLPEPGWWERPSPCSGLEAQGGTVKQRREKFAAGRGEGQSGRVYRLSPGEGGGPRSALPFASPPARVVYIPGVSFKPRAAAGSWPSPAASGQSPVKIC